MGLDTTGGPIGTIRVASFAHSLVARMPPSYPWEIEGETDGMAEAKRALLAILAADVAGYPSRAVATVIDALQSWLVGVANDGGYRHHA